MKKGYLKQQQQQQQQFLNNNQIEDILFLTLEARVELREKTVSSGNVIIRHCKSANACIQYTGPYRGQGFTAVELYILVKIFL